VNLAVPRYFVHLQVASMEGLIRMQRRVEPSHSHGSGDPLICSLAVCVIGFCLRRSRVAAGLSW
jgi:hypothetical protein